MTVAEVKELLYRSFNPIKISHPYFSNDEFITNKEGGVKTEDGYSVPYNGEFWDIRKDWTNWYIKE